MTRTEAFRIARAAFSLPLCVAASADKLTYGFLRYFSDGCTRTIPCGSYREARRCRAFVVRLFAENLADGVIDRDGNWIDT